MPLNEVFFPSCNFTSSSPETAGLVRKYLSAKMPVAGCCKTDKRNYSENKIIYFCQACRETLEKKYNGTAETENLFVWLDNNSDFPFPDYSGLSVTVQDCWRDREHPEIFDAVRSCLKKMNVNIVEMDERRENSRYCGSIHFEPLKEENRALLASSDNVRLSKLPKEIFGSVMLEQTEKYPVSTVVGYCNTCLRGLKAAGAAGWNGRPVHLLEMCMGRL